MAFALERQRRVQVSRRWSMLKLTLDLLKSSISSAKLTKDFDRRVGVAPVGGHGF